MYWKRLRPYIVEALTFILVVALLCCVFILTDLIAIRVTALTIALFITIGLWLIVYVFSFLIFSIKVLLDLLTKDYIRATVKFVEQYPFKSSPFLDKRIYRKETGVQNVENLYFKVVVKESGSTILLTNTEYFEFEKGKTYNLEYGRRSRALVNIIS